MIINAENLIQLILIHSYMSMSLELEKKLDTFIEDEVSGNRLATGNDPDFHTFRLAKEIAQADSAAAYPNGR